MERERSGAADSAGTVAPGSRPTTPLSVGFILPFGEPSEGYFPDTLLELCCARARELGHTARLVRVYYEGDSGPGDSLVRSRLAAWLSDNHIDLVVAERVFDPAPILAHLAGSPSRRAALLSWGDGDIIEGFDLVIGRTAGRTKGDRTRRSPSAGDLVRAFEGLLHALSEGLDPSLTPGVARVENGTLVSAERDAHPRPRAQGSAPPRGAAPPKALPMVAQGGAQSGAPLPRPFVPALDHDLIAAREPPPITRKYLFGNAGCPFSDDPAENPHYRGLDLDASPTLSRLGCAFCNAGGDYQKRPDAEVLDELIEQAAFYQSHLPDLRDLVLVDQHAPRLLAPLLRAADERGLRPARWLFSARADAFVRELPRVREALSVAAERGHRLSLYLSGFEAFCDGELARYNKGADVATLLRAVRTMRALAREHTSTFDYTSARGHSLILWSPWTTPEDLLETTAHLRAEGLLELFDDIGKNRLRLYEDLPITLAAARDGALTTAWDEGDEGAARQKGYAVERPWSFLDRRTRLAFTLARGLRKTLGAETELPQLEAAARFAKDAVPQAPPPPLDLTPAASPNATPPTAETATLAVAVAETATLPVAVAKTATLPIAVAETTALPAPVAIAVAETTALLAPVAVAETATLPVAVAETTALPIAVAETATLAQAIFADVRALSSLLRGIAEGESRAPRLATIRAEVVLFGGPCNNGCAACANRDRYQEDDEQTLFARVDSARNQASGAHRAIALAGREPSIHPSIVALVARAASGPRPLAGHAASGPRPPAGHAASEPRPPAGHAARGQDARIVGLVTNGRRFAYRPFSQAIVRAGLACASVKIFAPDAPTADAIARDEGAHAQATAGLTELARAQIPFEIRLPVNALALAKLPDAADLAARTRARGLRIEATLDAIGLENVGKALDAIHRLEARCASLGVALTASRLESGTRAFDALPAPNAG